ncbi:MAG TPA: SpoVG family protein [Phycisphaerae bacterium]|nr:septation protein SpoVG family protein [Phycisphaerales bacterium]HRX87783.1 SpoVG family protein [Phycisphaerae bacterium]
MEITEVQVKLIGNGDERLKASCTLVVDGEFVIRDVKVIEGTSGLFVAMPSRKLTDHCPRCSSKNHLRAQFCNNCGAKLPENRAAPRGGSAGAQQMHVEIAHPINSDCRQRLHERVISAYEQALSEQPNGKAHASEHGSGFTEDEPRHTEPRREQPREERREPQRAHVEADVGARVGRESPGDSDDFGAGLL